MAKEDTITVFTHRSPDGIKADGGSERWVLNPKRVRLCKWVICTQNQHSNDARSNASEPHGTAFLIGKISGVVRAPENQKRWLIKISEYAEINVPNAWGGYQNPIHYGSLAELGVNPESLQFNPMPEEREPVEELG
jgi:hypothetical protein